MTRKHIVVQMARRASPETIKSRTQAAAHARHLELSDSPSFVYDVCNYQTLSASLKDWIWRLFSDNMRSLYENSSEGWDPAAKRPELFHSESRFFVARDPQTRSPLGYTVFRFDTEETSGDELADVVYCYELQVDPQHHRKGIGRLLVQLLMAVAAEFKMDKVMLTVFKANTQAITFYERAGFVTDELDPSRYGKEDADYRIFSRACQSRS